MQKPFFSLLSALCFWLLTFAFISCHFNPDKQTPGQGYLQGEWQQDSVAGQKRLLTYSIYHLKFSCDSFFVSIRSYSRVNTGADSCMDAGNWTEYCRGTYQQKHDTLHLKGQFVNKDMNLKDEKGCFRAGDYEELFKVTKKTDSLVQFASTSNVIPINARLIKTFSCTPKPL